MQEVVAINCTVLVADDSPDTLEVIGYALRMSGYQVCFASDGIEALKILEEICCQVVVSDLSMPNVDGIELLHAIRARPDLRHLPFVLMSAAHGDLGSAASQIDGLLAKPFNLDELLSMLARVLGKTDASAQESL